MTESLHVVVCARAVDFSDPRGGLERAVGDHVRALLSSGLEVTLLTADGGRMTTHPRLSVVVAPWPRRLPRRGPGFSLGYVVWVRAMGRRLEQVTSTRHVDVVHFHGGTVGALRFAHVRRLLEGIPTVSNPHGMEEFQPADVLRNAARAPLRWLGRGARRASRVIATDAGLRASVCDNLGVDEARTHVIPNVVDIERLDALAAASTSAVRTPGGVHVVSVGRIVHNKGYDLLAEALTSVSLELPADTTLSWTHFGSGPDESRVRALLSRPHRLKFQICAGRTDSEVQTAMRHASLFVQPSRYEGSSLTTLEAMAHSQVVVGTAVGGIPDKISDGNTGFLADPTASSIARTILAALASGEAVGRRARERVEQEFSLEASARQHYGLYRSLVETNR